MSQYIPTENKLVTCPYDEAHKVKESRLQLHIAKCKLNHLDLAKKVCPFNATHLLPVGEYEYHLISCPDRGIIDRQFAQPDSKNNPFKGRTDVPQYSDPVQNDEVWEVGEHVVQLSAPPVGAVLQPAEFATPSQRKAEYYKMHQLPTKAEEVKTQSIKDPVPIQAPPRQPKAHSIFEDSNKPNVEMMENLGLGRGKPVSRIAANFSVESPNPPSYSSIVRGGDMGSLGLGRGMSTKSNKTSLPPSYDSDDLLALGCGRGFGHKQNVSRHVGAKPKN